MELLQVRTNVEFNQSLITYYLHLFCVLWKNLLLSCFVLSIPLFSGVPNRQAGICV
jgi:hypothetical protein